MMKYLILLSFIAFNLHAEIFPKAFVKGEYHVIRGEYYFVVLKDKRKIKVDNDHFRENRDKNFMVLTLDMHPNYYLDQINENDLSGDDYLLYYSAMSEFFSTWEQDKNVNFEANNKLSWTNIFFTESFAGDEDTISCEDPKYSNRCFFGGWPSEMVSGRCVGPWTDNGKKASIDIIGSSYNDPCGNKDLFRCNPTIYGGFDPRRDSTQNVDLIDLEKSSDKGLCVKLPNSSYRGLTTLCEKASSVIPGRLEVIKNKKPALVVMKNLADCFCRKNPGYDACLTLNERLKKIVVVKPLDAVRRALNTISSTTVTVTKCEKIGEGVEMGTPNCRKCFYKLKCETTTSATVDSTVNCACGANTETLNKCYTEKSPPSISSPRVTSPVGNTLTR